MFQVETWEDFLEKVFVSWPLKGCCTNAFWETGAEAERLDSQNFIHSPIHSFIQPLFKL